MKKLFITAARGGFALVILLLASTPARSATRIAAWGEWAFGQTNLPSGLTNAVSVAAGFSHAAAVRADGTVVVWGSGLAGQTNVPASATNVIAVAAGISYCAALRTDGTVVAWGSALQSAVPNGLTGVVMIAGGSSHVLALRRDGSIAAWGANVPGISLPPDGVDGFSAIAAGGSHSLALKRNGTILGWGTNNHRQITVPADATNVVAIAAGTSHSLALRSDGTVVAWGLGNLGQTTLPAGLSNVVSISASGHFNLALKQDGSVIAWGANQSGQAMVPVGTTNASIAAAGGTFGVALMDLDAPVTALRPGPDLSAGVGEPAFFQPMTPPIPGSDYQWLRGQLPIPGATNRTLLIGSPSLSDSGDYHLLQTFGGRTASNGIGGLAVGHVLVRGSGPSVSYTLAARLTNVVDLAVGGSHCLALLSDGNIVGWGLGASGQLNIPAALSNVARIYAGQASSYALRHDGSVVGWGMPTNMTAIPAAMTNVVSLTIGSSFISAVRRDGSRVYQGPPFPSAETFGTERDLVGETLSTGGWVLLKGTGTLSAKAPADVNQFIGANNAANVVAAVAGGASNLVFLLADGRVSASLPIASGLFPPVDLDDVIAVRSGISHGWAIRQGGGMIPLGLDQGGQRAVPPEAESISILAAGFNQTLFYRGPLKPRVYGIIDRITAVGERSVFHADVSGSGAMSFQWLKDGQPIMDATNAALVLQSVSAGDVGSYSVSVSNQLGTTTSPAAALSLTRLAEWNGSRLLPVALPVPRVVGAGSGWRFGVMADGRLVQWSAAEGTFATVSADMTNLLSLAVAEDRVMTLRSNANIVVWRILPDGSEVERSSFRVANVTKIALGSRYGVALRSDGDALAVPFDSWASDPWTLFDAAESPVVDVSAWRERTAVVRANGSVQSRTESCNYSYTTLTRPVTNAVAVSCVGQYDFVLHADQSVSAWLAEINFQEPVYPAFGPFIRLAGSYGIKPDGSAVMLTLNPTNSVSFPAAFRPVTALAYGDGTLVVGSDESLPPTVTPLANRTVVGGRTVFFRADVSGTPPFTFRWRRDGIDLPGETNQVLALTPTNLSLAGGYSVAVTNASGGTVGSAANLSVVAARITRQPSSQAILVGGSTNLSVSAYGLEPLAYQWRRNGADIDGATNSTFAITNARPGGSATFSVRIITPMGSIDSVPAKVSATPVLTRDGQPIAIPDGDSDVVAISSSLYYNNSIGLRRDGYVFTWGFYNLADMTVPEGLSNVVQVAAGYESAGALTGDGRLVFWGRLSSWQTNELKGLSNVAAIAGSDRGFTALTREGELISSDPQMAGSSAAGLKFRTNLVAIAMGLHSETALDAQGRLRVWSNPDKSVPSPSGFTAMFPNSSGSHWLRDHADTLVPSEGVSFLGPVASNATAVSFSSPWVILGRDGRLKSTGSPPAEFGGFPLITQLAGKSMLMGIGAPYIVTQPIHRSGAAGGSAVFTVEATGEPPFDFQWLQDSTGIPHATNASLALSNLAPSNAGLYSVTVSNRHGVARSGASRLAVVPALFNDVQGKTAMLPQGVFNLSFEVTSAEPRTFQWHRDGMPLPGFTNLLLTITNPVPADAGRYSLALTTASGSSTSPPVRIPYRTIQVWPSSDPLLGDIPDDLTNAISVAAGPANGLAIRPDGTVAVWGQKSSEIWQQFPTNLSGVAAISAGQNHVLALLSNGTVRAWGTAYNNLTNVPADLTDAIAVHADVRTSKALRKDGSIVSWAPRVVPGGAAAAGFVSLGTLADLRHTGRAVKSIPFFFDPTGLGGLVALSVSDDSAENRVVGLRSDGTVLQRGAAGEASASNGVAVLADYNFGLILRADGSVVSMVNPPSPGFPVPPDQRGITDLATSGNFVIGLIGTADPRFIALPPDRTAAIGGETYFYVRATGRMPLSYQWRHNGTNLASPDLPMLGITNVQPSHAGIYSLVVTDAIGASAETRGFSLAIQEPGILTGSARRTPYVFEYSLASRPGSAFTITASTNLVNWFDPQIVTNTSGQDAVNVFPSAPTGFFRVIPRP